MSSGSFPGSALLIQLFRQLTKPLSKKIVNYAKTRPTFSKYFLLLPGRAFHQLDCRIKYYSTVSTLNAKQTKPKTFKPCSDTEAINLASQLMIEVVLFALLVVVVILEWLRSSIKTAKEEEQKAKDFEVLEDRKSALRSTLESQALLIQQLKDHVAFLSQH